MHTARAVATPCPATACPSPPCLATAPPSTAATTTVYHAGYIPTTAAMATVGYFLVTVALPRLPPHHRPPPPAPSPPPLPWPLPPSQATSWPPEPSPGPTVTAPGSDGHGCREHLHSSPSDQIFFLVSNLPVSCRWLKNLFLIINFYNFAMGRQS